MQIDAKQLVSATPKKIGKKDGKDVLAIATKGGLHVIVSPKDGKFETLGTGPHIAVARFIASKRNPGIVWTGLSKADHVPEQFFLDQVPKYEAYTIRLRKLQGDE